MVFWILRLKGLGFFMYFNKNSEFRVLVLSIIILVFDVLIVIIFLFGEYW